MAKAAFHCKICRTNNRGRLLFTVVLLAFVIIYIGINVVDYLPYTGNKLWDTVKSKCFYADKQRTNLVKLAYRMHSILDNMGIEHWLMYGSLWGPMRGIPGPLPWDYDIDIAIDGDGNFSKIPFEEFKARFTVAGLKVTDHSGRSGRIRIEGNGENGDLYLYYDHGGVMTLTGYESWLFFLSYRLHHSFPTILIHQPLPKVRFGFFNISVPRGGIEVMKYLYPFSWWKVVKPPSCQYHEGISRD